MESEDEILPLLQSVVKEECKHEIDSEDERNHYSQEQSYVGASEFDGEEKRKNIKEEGKEEEEEVIKPPLAIFIENVKCEIEDENEDEEGYERADSVSSDEYVTPTDSGVPNGGVPSTEDSSADIAHKTCFKSGLSKRKGSSAIDKGYQCDICQKVFKRKWNFLEHQEYHSEYRAYQCDVCQKSFKTKRNLLEHKKNHTQDRAYQCDVCPKSFKTKRYLTWHKKYHIQDCVYKCDVCHKSFKRKSDLTRHVKYHTEVGAYECQVCKKLFMTKGNLYSHLKCHSEEKAFKCDGCHKTFKWKSNLTVHKEYHKEQDIPI